MEVTKKKSKHVGLILLIVFIVIVIGIITYVVINYTNDQAEIKKRMNLVKENYQTFKEEATNFNNNRDTIYNEVMKDMYYQTLKDNDERYKELYNNYQQSLTKIDKIYNKTKDNCINALYPDVTINNKCEALVIGYEKIVNTYVSDVNLYKINIEKYNNWLEETSSIDVKLEKIKTNRKYIDINGDRKYEGKKEVKEGTKGEDDGKVPSE